MRGQRKASALLALVALAGVRADAVPDVSGDDLATQKGIFLPTAIKGAFVEQFSPDWKERWTPSSATKKTPVGTETYSYVGKWSVEESSKLHAIDGDLGLVAKSPASHHAISAPLDAPLKPAGKPLVVQYEVKFQKGGNCGGGYMKLLEEGYEKDGEYNDKTPWVIMFGPDLTCPGTKVHFIFRHQNPITKEWEEKHLTAPPSPVIESLTKLYTLIVKPDNTFEILIDDESVKTGNLLEDFSPAVNPPTEINDPDDKKPEDWIDTATIPDPDAKKPEDWDEDAPYSIPDEDAVKPEGWLDDEPATIPDPDSEKPEEWDDEEDGEWVAPTIPNPKCEEAPGCGEWTRPTKPNPAYKGKWFAPNIDNPAYKGVWAPRKIANPGFFEDKSPANFHTIGGVGFEIWTMTEDILFDNIYIGHSPEDAKALAQETFHLKSTIEKKAQETDSKKDAESSQDSLDGKYSWKETIELFKKDPVEWVRGRATAFALVAAADPVLAFKQMPETGAAFVAVALTFLGSLGALLGLVGGSKAVKPVAKKVETAAANVKESATTTATELKEAATKRK